MGAMTSNSTRAGPAGTDRSGKSLRSQVRSAVIWRSGTQILGQLVSWVSTFLVIRILDPGDYGLVAMTGAIMLLLSLANGYSFANAIIQRDQVDQHVLRQLFSILIAMNVVLAAVQLIAAPFAAAYYREPMVADLLRVQALIYPTTPFIALAYAVLSRELEFRRQAQVNIISAVLAALAAISGALAGWGVWTLVVAPLVGAYVTAIGYTLAARTLVWPTLRFAGAGFILRFGGYILAGQIFWFIQSQADIFIVGRIYDAHELGIYSTALFLAQIFLNKVVPPLNEVAFSAYSRFHHQAGGVAAAFTRSVQMIMFMALPVFIGMAVTAEPLVLVMLGEKWAATIPFVALLALAMPFKTMLSLLGPASNATGRPDLPTRNSIAGAVIMPAAFLISLTWGLIGIAYAWIVGFGLLIALALYWTLPALGVRFGDLARALQPPVIASLAMGSAVLITDSLVIGPDMPLVARLAALVAIGATVYAGWLLLFARRCVFEIATIIANREPSVAPDQAGT